MSSLPREAWWGDEEIEHKAFALWSDAIYHGRERAGAEEAKWENRRDEYRRQVCVVLDAGDGETP